MFKPEPGLLLEQKADAQTVKVEGICMMFIVNNLLNIFLQNKELMHKLRSMTETIKMLSKENESLRGENSDLLRATTRDDNQPGNNGGKTKQDMRVHGRGGGSTGVLAFPRLPKSMLSGVFVYLSSNMYVQIFNKMCAEITSYNKCNSNLCYS